MKEEDSRFRWNLGGLIGSAFGYGTWIVLTPLLAKWPTSGLIFTWGLILTLPFSVVAVWSMRKRWSALRGMNVFLALAFGVTLTFLLYAHLMKLPLVTSWPPTRLASAANSFPFLLIFPALALLFLLLSRSHNKTNGPSPNPHHGRV